MRYFTIFGKLLASTVLSFMLTISVANGQVEDHQGSLTPNQQTAIGVSLQDRSEDKFLNKDERKLSAEVERLKKKVTELQAERTPELIHERLTKEELRAESLQTRLLEVTEKQAGLQDRLTVIEQQLVPENIERMLAGVGTSRPEDARQAIHQRLTTQKQGIQSQLELLEQEQKRLEASLETADAAIERLRMQLREAAVL